MEVYFGQETTARNIWIQWILYNYITNVYTYIVKCTICTTMLRRRIDNLTWATCTIFSNYNCLLFHRVEGKSAAPGFVSGSHTCLDKGLLHSHLPTFKKHMNSAVTMILMFSNIPMQIIIHAFSEGRMPKGEYWGGEPVCSLPRLGRRHLRRGLLQVQGHGGKLADTVEIKILNLSSHIVMTT